MALLAVIAIEGVRLGGEGGGGREEDEGGGTCLGNCEARWAELELRTVHLTRDVCECVVYGRACARTVGEELEACARRIGCLFWRPPVLI